MQLLLHDSGPIVYGKNLVLSRPVVDLQKACLIFFHPIGFFFEKTTVVGRVPGFWPMRHLSGRRNDGRASP
jgi:hypothetical protein